MRTQNYLCKEAKLLDQPNSQIPFSRLQTYLKNSLVIHPQYQLITNTTRALIKWFFDFLRNLLIAGLLLFLGIKSNNANLQYFAYVIVWLLSLYLFSYLNFWIISPFYWMKNQTLARWFDITVHALIYGALSVASVFLVGEIVKEIAFSYLSK